MIVSKINMVEILQTWIERQRGMGNAAPAAFGETLIREYGDFPLPGMMEFWITMQRSQGNIGPAAIGQTLIDQWGDFPLNDSPAKVLSRFSPVPIPLEWTEVLFTPAEERGKIEIYNSITDYHKLVNIRCNDIVLNTHRLQLLDLRSRGFGNTAIAERLHRSVRTVETHLAQAREAMQKGEEQNHNLPTITEFFVHCARIGLLDPNLIPAMKANFELPDKFLHGLD